MIRKFSPRRILIALACLLGIVGAYCVVKLCQGYTVSFFGSPHFVVPPNESTVEAAGLRLTLHSLRKQEKQVRVDYALEWIPPAHNEKRIFIWSSFRNWMTVSFWDEDGREVFVIKPDEEPENEKLLVQVSIGVPLALEETFTSEGSVLITPPAEAKWISISILGLSTNKVTIPAET